MRVVFESDEMVMGVTEVEGEGGEEGEEGVGC